MKPLPRLGRYTTNVTARMAPSHRSQWPRWGCRFGFGRSCRCLPRRFGTAPSAARLCGGTVKVQGLPPARCLPGDDFRLFQRRRLPITILDECWTGNQGSDRGHGPRGRSALNPFIPEFDGQLELARVPDDFITRIRKRVEEGLLMRGNRKRANYAVRSAGNDEITFGAEDFLTAYNVGLNDVSVRRSGANTMRYHVTFWRWTLTAVVHGAILGLAFLICFLTFQGLQRDVAAYAQG